MAAVPPETGPRGAGSLRQCDDQNADAQRRGSLRSHGKSRRDDVHERDDRVPEAPRESGDYAFLQRWGFAHSGTHSGSHEKRGFYSGMGENCI